MKTGPLFLKLRECEKKIIILQGGGDSGKTTSALQYLGVDSIENDRLLTTITGQDIPNLKGGALRTFEKYVLPDIDSHIQSYNKTDRIYTLKNKSVIEFKSFENELDARGSERDNLFMNEANSQTYNLFWQLQRKTRRKVILDYNPTAPFFVHETIMSGKEAQFNGKWERFITDHRHNPFLTKEEHEAYESISDPDLFRVYARGLTGKIKGLIFGHFKKVDLFPEAGRIIWGCDYGYTNDPTALVKIACEGRKRTGKELCYRPGVTAEEIRDLLFLNGYNIEQPFYSEADPNMINQLRMLGIPAMPAIKGPGSIIAGISKVRQYECFYTADSLNFEKELGMYKWVMAQDLATGKEVMTNQPMDAWNHCCDGFRMACYTDSFRQ